MKKKFETYIVPLSSHTVIKAEMSHDEFSVLLAALKHYNNGYGNTLLKRLEKAKEW